MTAILLAVIFLTTWWQSRVEQFANITPWFCRPVNGQFLGVRKNADGDVQCMASDSKNCMWTGNMDACNNTLTTKVPQLLTCGKNHKAAYGETGYSSNGHWCNTLMGQIHEFTPEDTCFTYVNE